MVVRFIKIIILYFVLFIPAIADKSEILEAIKKNDSEKIKLLIEGGEDINTDNEFGITLVHWASINGSISILDLMYKNNKNLDIHSKNGSRWTPLMSAAYNGQIETVRFLIDHGADINSQDMFNRTPLIYSLESKNSEIAQYLVKMGADVELKDELGQTPLQLAVVNGEIGLVNLIIEKGADINSENSFGVTALYLSKEYGYSEIEKILKLNGAR